VLCIDWPVRTQELSPCWRRPWTLDRHQCIACTPFTLLGMQARGVMLAGAYVSGPYMNIACHIVCKTILLLETKYQFFYVCWPGAMQRNPMQADNAMYQLFQKEAVLVLMMNASEGVVNKFTDSSCRNLIQSRIQFCIERCMHACVGPTLFICLI
jgi:hypothetical protein